MTLHDLIKHMSTIKEDEMYRVMITGYRLVTHGKSYYVYSIQVTEPNSGILYVIERRYSEFNSLHRKLKKKETNIAPFPPKKLRNSQLQVLEQRRAALELYLQKMLQLSTTKQQVLEFLGITGKKKTSEMINSNRMNEINENNSNVEIGHYPIVTFTCDPYLTTKKRTSLPDIVTQGVLLGIYKTNNF
ncbi:sorting nexin-22-like [Aphidius gifuensis]|uniref:sorting nexin-22-like n=1 Tax=Aphidius gifuensis TaxID=684658 RepID=UPI001CDD4EC8|nr:sorting nexin-22-like [Aphidius gifuensis]